ncbi:MAG: cellulase family glycosylhydrolase [Thermoanaerobaculia bacterium]|nr:cellulase family glycosylhydrolase [Thermoanaerobaculia bacterium]
MTKTHRRGRKLWITTCALVLLAASAAATDPPSNPMVHAQGTRLVDGSGEPIKLRGVLLEGWLMWNGSLWGTGMTSETKITQRIEGLVGEEETARFRKAVYDTFVTERDLEMIAQLGLNVVRVPFNHTVFEKDGAIDNSAPGWYYLDRLVDWCEKHGIYVVLDLHAVPGGQSGVFVADPDPKQVWASEPDLERTVDIWKAIATRYRDRSIVAGYDLINEPEPPQGQDLIDLYRRIIKEIRAIDPHHLIFLAGTALSTEFGFYEGPLDANQAYTFHTYDFLSHDIDDSRVAKLARLAEAHNVPLWNGEFGAHTDRWTSSQIDLFEDPKNHVNGWIYWPWKRVSENDWRRERFGHLMEIESTESWDTVRKHIGSIFGLKKTPEAIARRALAEFLEASKAGNLVADERMVAVLKGWQQREPPASPEPAAPAPAASTRRLAADLPGNEERP